MGETTHGRKAKKGMDGKEEAPERSRQGENLFRHARVHHEQCVRPSGMAALKAPAQLKFLGCFTSQLQAKFKCESDLPGQFYVLLR